MLRTLKIKNYALLKDVEIEFGPGLNILTGETGAGKSIILGAVNTIIGERGWVENIRTGEDKAVVEAVFEIEEGSRLASMVGSMLEEAGIEQGDGQLVIHREIARNSKGRINVNNTNASLAFLEKIGALLVDMHGQHEHQSLLKDEIHIHLLDNYALCSDLRAQTALAFAKVSLLDTELKSLRALEAEKSERLEMVSFRIEELDELSPGADTELDDLNREREMMVHTEAIKEAANSIVTLLQPGSVDQEGDGAIDQLSKAKDALETIGKFDAKSKADHGPVLDDAIIKAEELRDYFAEYADRVSFDRDRLAEIEERITAIESLMKKYKKGSVRELKLYHEELKEEKKKIEFAGEAIRDKEKERDARIAETAALCARLSAIRKTKAKNLGRAVEEELKDLGIGKGVFDVRVRPIEASAGDTLTAEIDGVKCRLTAQGTDSVEFMISLNPGEEVKPLVKIASGGEVSRIMLAIKNILAAADPVPVMVFDEIDTGISGKTAGVVGKKLREISRKKQLICITHLPQIAACADTHYSVGKSVEDGKTETRIEKLDAARTAGEVAKLLSGDRVTDASLQAAGELIDAAKKG